MSPRSCDTAALSLHDALPILLHFVGELIPDRKYKYAMGIGQPDDIAYCVEIGWDLFDTVLPTRNARHGYLYVSKGDRKSTRLNSSQLVSSYVVFCLNKKKIPK